MWGRYERGIVTSGLSKAYGLPGLRIGWVAAPPSLVEELWSLHDYTTIAPGAVSDRLARIALAPARRQTLLARTQGIVRTNYPLVQKWIERAARRCRTSHPTQGRSCSFGTSSHQLDDARRADTRRTERADVPGDHFEMDGYVRIGFGIRSIEPLGGLQKFGRRSLPIAAASDAR